MSIRNDSNSPKNRGESTLKGTLVFVMSIGTFILISWFIVFFLFLGRI
ncbi:cytochrome c oxidase subunit 2A [Evansella halocellulosilytica]|nr:cytochrome c oxidase subunit 2A [Evansella halocellulosilytica]